MGESGSASVNATTRELGHRHTDTIARARSHRQRQTDTEGEEEGEGMLSKKQRDKNGVWRRGGGIAYLFTF
jgi:hypothetical protein